MKKKIVLHIFSVFLFTAIPAFLSYMANSTLIFEKLINNNFLSENVNIGIAQDYCLWIGILLSAFFLSGRLILKCIQFDRAQEERNSLLQMNKEILSSALCKMCSPNQFDFDIRIFIPKYQLLYKLANYLHIKKIKQKFMIKNIDLIANTGITKNLEFEVYPHQEGLVGICYTKKALVYDDNLESTNNSDYNLDQTQISRTSNLKWSICCPIFADRDTVVAILALDGKSKITIKKENETALRDQLVGFSRFLFDSAPQLFRR